MYTHTHTFAHTHTHTHTHTLAHTHTHTVAYTHTHARTHARARLYVTLGLFELGSNLRNSCILGRESYIVNNLVKIQAILKGKYVVTYHYIFSYLLFNRHITLCKIIVLNGLLISLCCFHLASLSSYLSKVVATIPTV
jgi:hypothetical protein